MNFDKFMKRQKTNKNIYCLSFSKIILISKIRNIQKQLKKLKLKKVKEKLFLKRYKPK